jgi:hypothetical protein
LTVRRGGQLPGGQAEVAELDEGVAAALRRRALVAGAPARGRDGLDGRGDLLAADLVELERAAPAAAEHARQGARAALGGVGFGAVGVEPGGVEVHGLAQSLMRHPLGELDQFGLDAGHVHAERGGLTQPPRGHDRRDRGDLVGADRAGSERRLRRRQVLEGPAGVDQPLRRRIGQQAVGAQPGAHRLQAIPLRRLGRLGPADGAGQFGIEAVSRTHQCLGSIEQLAVAHRQQVVGRERIQSGLQLAHDTSSADRTYVRILDREQMPCKGKVLVRPGNGAAIGRPGGAVQSSFTTTGRPAFHSNCSSFMPR